jgi:hypothetical protein
VSWRRSGVVPSSRFVNNCLRVIRKKKSRTSKVQPDRGHKGLRYFSIQVCQKLSTQLKSTYNDIANLLVKESKPSAAEVRSVMSFSRAEPCCLAAEQPGWQAQSVRREEHSPPHLRRSERSDGHGHHHKSERIRSLLAC